MHKYWWINQRRPPLEVGDDAYYVAVSNWYSDPEESFGRLFESIEPPDTIRVEREGAHVKNAFVYRLRGYNGEPLVTVSFDLGDESRRDGGAGAVDGGAISGDSRGSAR